MRRAAFALLACACLTFGTACGDDDGGDGGGTPDAGGGGGDGGAGPDAYVPPEDSFTVTWGPVTVPPGTEATRCVVKRVGNPSMLRVNRIHNVLGATSHHFIIYRTAETEEKATPFDCQPFADTLDPSKGSPLMITQKHEEELVLPAGVAFTLEPNQMIRLEMHYINAGDSAVEASASATFIPIPDAEFQHEADFLFIGSPDIHIPPNSSTTLGPVEFQLPARLGLAGSKFFGITGHTHQYGTDVKVWADTTQGANAPVYDVPGWQWDEPATVMHDPPFELSSSQKFRFQCAWTNTSSQTLRFGESANDEMCFFWAYYYPSKGAYVCAHTDQVPGGYDLCCPGDPACQYLF